MFIVVIGYYRQKNTVSSALTEKHGTVMIVITKTIADFVQKLKTKHCVRYASMTKRQIALRDNLQSGSNIYRRIEALKSFIAVNQAILEGISDFDLKKDLQQQISELEREYKSLLETRKKINRCIEVLDDPDMKSILISRYLGHKNTLQIAETMNYGRNTINRKHKKALSIIIEKGMDNIFYESS